MPPTILILLLVVAQSYASPDLPRVKRAYEKHGSWIKKLFREKGILFPTGQIFLRGFKKEKQLELWAVDGKSGNYVFIKNYPICKTSGVLGPKRRGGDEQIPEGVYTISGANPQSQFHLSLRLSYPNQSDHILGEKKDLGGDIFIHGGCVTIGCLPLTDNGIEELYVIVMETRKISRETIQVHIFPTQNWDELLNSNKDNSKLRAFWENLRSGFVYFEKNRLLPRIEIGADGKYIWK